MDEIREEKEHKSEENARNALTVLESLWQTLQNKNRQDSNTKRLETTIKQLQKYVQDFQDKTRNLAKNSDQYSLEEAILDNHVFTEVAALYKETHKTVKLTRSSTFVEHKIRKTVQGGLANLAGDEIANTVAKDILAIYLPNQSTQNVKITQILNALVERSRDSIGTLIKKLYPATGLLIYTTFAYESELGNKHKNEIREEQYFSGNLEPQDKPAIPIINYLTAVIGSGLFESIRALGSSLEVKSPLVHGWTLDDWGKSVISNIGNRQLIPTNTHMLSILADQRREKETNTAHLFTKNVDPARIKEINMVDQDKKIPHPKWQERYEIEYKLSTDQQLAAPMLKVFVVVPANNSDIYGSGQNKWKIAFYNEEQAKQFIELAKRHPYWYDAEKGWNLSGWPEKMQKIDFAINSLEAILGTFLNPTINVNFYSYLSHPHEIKKLPIYEELHMLKNLVDELLEIRSEQENVEHLQIVLQKIGDTFSHIQDSLDKKDERKIPYGAYGFSQALDVCLDTIKSQFDLKRDLEIEPVQKIKV